MKAKVEELPFHVSITYTSVTIKRKPPTAFYSNHQFKMYRRALPLNTANFTCTSCISAFLYQMHPCEWFPAPLFAQ